MQACVILDGLAPVADLEIVTSGAELALQLRGYMRSDATQPDVSTRLLRFVNDLCLYLDISLRILMAQPKFSWNLRETIESISPAR
jgi:hypothetical protein